ncbi:MAG TPA: hypothetical protein VGS22_03475 [Thermoanaerobaculia bacterium]|nr:hypothetical protein [Thermoanaerobaculia bacterium]
MPEPPKTLLERLAREIGEHSPLRKPTVELFLGTDEEIGLPHAQEFRVGITPDDVAQLRSFFSGFGGTLRVFVAKDAGSRAGYADAEYVQAGAEILTSEEIPSHGPPDVVHALKEPSRYEAGFPRGSFLRIGAAHWGDSRVDSGLGGLLLRRDVAIFDGSTIGAPDRFRTPIRASMSKFAGKIAAEWTAEHLGGSNLSGKVVVVGGGNAGRSCLENLHAQGIGPLVVLELADDPARLEAVRQGIAKDGVTAEVRGISGLDCETYLEAIDSAVGVVFAVAGPGGRTPRVTTTEALKRTAPGAIIVDISIDEGGAIEDGEAGEDWKSHRLIPHLEAKLRPRTYRAITNMPRAYPKKASAEHGKAVLPYLAALLYLSAREGGVSGALDVLTTKVKLNPTCGDPSAAPDDKVLEALLLDLRNGLSVYHSDAGPMFSPYIDEKDRSAMEALLAEPERS